MGQFFNLKTTVAAAVLLALLLVTAGTAVPDRAEARVPAAQTYPAISTETPPARDADTFAGDRTLEASCRKTGQEKAFCLCVTHIMKYELTLPEYRAVTRLYGRAVDRRDIHRTLKNEGFTPAEIKVAEAMEQSLVQSDDVSARCAEAKAYYKNEAN